jgi:hypothetical protein
MQVRPHLQIDLIRLVNGERLIRLTDPHSGLALEQKVDPTRPLARQKERLLAVFAAALAEMEAIVA